MTPRKEPRDSCQLWVHKTIAPLRNRLTAIMFLCIGLGINEGIKWITS